MVEAEISTPTASTEDGARRWAHAAPRLLEALIVNAVPVWGYLAYGWSLGTLLLLYWCENFLNTFFVGGRIWLHRRLTRKRGHWTQTVRTSGMGLGGKTAKTTLLANFVGTNFIFTLAHGVFVAAFVFGMFKVGPSAADLGHGLLWLLAGMSTSFVLDAARIRTWPFAWIKQRADEALGRTLVVHFAILGGMFLLMQTGRPAAFFLPFLIFKLLLDLAWAWPRATAEPKLDDEEVLDHVPS